MNTITTISLLLFTFVSLFILNQKQLLFQLHQDLDSELSMLVYSIQSSYDKSTHEHTIDHKWLSELERKTHSIIYIEEQCIPLLYSTTSHNRLDITPLISLCKERAVKTYHLDLYCCHQITSNLPNKVYFEIRPQAHERYLVGICSFISQETNYQIVILQDVTFNHAEQKKHLLAYIAIFVLVSIILIIFSFWFSGRAMIPIIENDKLQKSFISSASHELRTPLAVLNTNTSVLASKYPMIADSFFYHSIQSECRRMTKLISDLLLLSHADTRSNWSLNTTPTSIDTLLLNIYDQFFTLAKRKDHFLEISLPESVLPSCLLDQDCICQVLSILIDNALCHTPDNTIIKLVLERISKHEICIVVSDNGPGITPEHKPHIFKRFYTADYSRNNKDHFGLGLSIAYELISLHKGRLLLEDTLPHGCTFKIILPFIEQSSNKKGPQTI